MNDCESWFKSPLHLIFILPTVASQGIMLLMQTSSFLFFLLLFHSRHPIVQAKSCTTQLGSTKVSPVPTYTTAFTVTTTLTEYLTTITKTKTKGTTTIPTSPGFTPILSETTGTPDPQIAAAVAPGRNVATASFPATVFCTTTTTRTVTKSITDSHKVAASTVTVTSTATVPAATTYAACGCAFLSPSTFKSPFPPCCQNLQRQRSGTS